MSEKKINHEEELDNLKKELLKSLENREKGKSKKNNILVIGVLSILTFVSLAQTVQSAAILNKVETVKSSGISSTALPSNLESLPDMVGGC